jgi:hypothetical protein
VRVDLLNDETLEIDLAHEEANPVALHCKGGSKEMSEAGPRVVIVGGGFGGIAAAKALAKAPTQNIVIDRGYCHGRSCPAQLAQLVIHRFNRWHFRTDDV